MQLNQILVSLRSTKDSIHRESSRFPFLSIDSRTCSPSICGPGARAHSCGSGGDFGGPRADGAARAAEGGRALGLAARNSAGLQGGAGRRRPAWMTAPAAGLPPCLSSNTFFSPSFLTQPQLSVERTLALFLLSSLPSSPGLVLVRDI